MLPFNDANVSFKSFYDSINFLDEMAPYKKSYTEKNIETLDN